MSDTVEHKTYKQALLEFYQAKGIPSSEIKFEVKVEGSPHCPNFRCTLKLPRVPTTTFPGHNLFAEGKSKKAAEHAAAASALNHLRDVGLLKVPAPAARVTPPPQPPQPRSSMSNAAHGPHPHVLGVSGGHPWTSSAPRTASGAAHQRLRPAATSFLEPYPMETPGPGFQEASEALLSGETSNENRSALLGASHATSSASSLASGLKGSTPSETAKELALAQTASSSATSQMVLSLEDLKRGATEPFCINPERLPVGEANRQLAEANTVIQRLYTMLLEERQSRKLEAQKEKERRKFAAEVLLGIKDGDKKFLESDAMTALKTKALETKMGHLRLPTTH